MIALFRIHFIAPAMALLLSGGCGEVAYKTGAGADQLQLDQQSCKSANADPAQYRQCMKDKGWAIADLSGSPEPAPPTLAPAPAPAVSAPAATASGAGVAAQPASAQPIPPQPAPPTSTPPTADPMRRVPISGWVRFGEGAPDDAIVSCVATLGSAHQPDLAAHTVTAALLSCMHDKGWRAL